MDQVGDFTITIRGKVIRTGVNLSVSLSSFEVQPSTIRVEAVSEPAALEAEGKQTGIHDMIYEAATKLTSEGMTVFTAAQLYAEAVKKYPNVNKKSFKTYVIAASPEHTSYRHYRPLDEPYLRYLGKGTYKLRS